MGTQTTRQKLYKPAVTGEAVNVQTNLNDNYDKLDLYGPTFLCTNATRPGAAVYFTGMLIYETDTGNVYLWTGAAWQKVILDIAAQSFTGSLTVATNLTVTGDIIPSSQMGNRNRFDNGDFSVWQRGIASISAAGGIKAFGPDRYFVLSGTGATNTMIGTLFGVTGKTGYTADTSPYFCTWNRTVVGTTASVFAQRLEYVQTFALKTITFSFWAQAASGTVDLTPYVTQSFGTGGAPSGAVTTNGPALLGATTTPTRFTSTIAVPTVVGKTLGTTANTDYLEVGLSRAIGGNGVTGAVDIWEWQVELGSNATPFEKLPLEVTLAKCQRHYYRITAVSATHYMCSWAYTTTTTGYGIMAYPVTMRATPVGAVSGATDASILVSGGALAGTAFGIDPYPQNVRVNVTTAVNTAGLGGYCYLNAVAKWLEMSAEQ